MKQMLLLAWIFVCAACCTVRADTLFIADYHNSKIHKFSTSGISQGSLKVEYPVNMAIDPSGNIYASTITGKLVRFSSSGRAKSMSYQDKTYIDSYGPMSADTEGYLYIANPGYNTLEKFSPSGAHQGKASFTGIANSTGMTSDRQGNLYAANVTGINKFGPGGVHLGVFISGVFQVRCLACDSAGNLYLIAPGRGYIEKYSPSGSYMGIVAYTEGSVSYLCSDRNDNLYTISHGGLVQKFAPNGSLLASFVVQGVSLPMAMAVGSSFEELTGSFTGTYEDSSGGLQLTFTKTGAFTAKISKIASKPLSVRGQLNSQGDFSGTAGAQSVPIAFTVASGNGTPGSISCSGSVGGTSFTAYQQVYAKGMTAGDAAAYTVIFGNDGGAPSLPNGYGFSSFKVSSRGIAKMAGRLADGTKITCSGPVIGSSSGSPAFAVTNTTLYQKQGGLVGSSYFYDWADSDLRGSVRWVKTASKGPLAGSFSADIPLWGSTFEKPGPSEPILPSTGFLMEISGADLGPLISSTGTLTPQGKLLIEDNPHQIKASINKAGVWTGTFLHGPSGKKVKFQGMAYQHPGYPWCAGYFISPPVGGISQIGEVSMWLE